MLFPKIVNVSFHKKKKKSNKQTELSLFLSTLFTTSHVFLGLKWFHLSGNQNLSYPQLRVVIFILRKKLHFLGDPCRVQHSVVNVIGKGTGLIGVNNITLITDNTLYYGRHEGWEPDSSRPILKTVFTTFGLCPCTVDPVCY